MIYAILITTGLCFGSFVGALTWRIRARQLAQDKSEKEYYDKNEYRILKKLTKADVLNDRSQCLHCEYQLQWYDLIPLFSWLSLKGRCRSCHQKIGSFEPIIELSMMAFFVISYAFWPYALTNILEISRFIAWIISGIIFGILASYDAKWFLLPDRFNYYLICLGVIVSGLVIFGSQDVLSSIFSIAGSVFILSGFYLLLYLVSKGRWIGLGDIKLGLGLALLLADWRLAFIALFAANMVGTLFVIPGMITGKIKRTQHVPFGPFLIIGTIIAQITGIYIINMYMSILV